MSLRRVLILSVASASAFACGGSDPEASGSPGTGAGGSAVGPTGTGGGGTGNVGSGAGTGSGSGAGAGPSSGSGGASGGSTSIPSGPVDCSGITQAGYELCSSGPDFCAAVFDDSAGCAAVCAKAGLGCAEVYDNEADECSGDMSSPLSCSGTGHESDYCVCKGSGGNPGTGSGGTGSAGSGNGGTGNAGTGNAGSGGTGTAGTGSGGTGNTGPTGTTCSSISEFGTVNSTIVVKSGETYDGGCKRFKAGSSLGDGSQDEGQDPVFVLEDGATIKNVVLGFPAADGIHTEGDANLYNIHWEDIGEDALTVEGSGTVVLDGGSAYKGADKTFQINAGQHLQGLEFQGQRCGQVHPSERRHDLQDQRLHRQVRHLEDGRGDLPHRQQLEHGLDDQHALLGHRRLALHRRVFRQHHDQQQHRVLSRFGRLRVCVPDGSRRDGEGYAADVVTDDGRILSDKEPNATFSNPFPPPGSCSTTRRREQPSCRQAVLLEAPSSAAPRVQQHDPKRPAIVVTWCR